MTALLLSKAFAKSFKILLAVTLVSTTFGAIASAEQPDYSNEPEPLQTEITQQDLKIIEQLVAVAERNSAEVLEKKAAMGLNAFTDIIALEFSPSVTTTSTSPDSSSERENSFYFAVTIDPIKFISTFGQLPVLQARWKEARQQKRLAIVQYYVAYIQARQAAMIAAYRMQKFTGSSRIASIDSRASSRQNNHLANPDYVAAATSMLDTNTRKRLALEELAACVGLSVQELSVMIDK
ncbi:hypothetical protein QUB80_10605 [Chlorogloeopsis sp. ULAP01]|uniref:hypothetical protein n=1 Tax=Chlorogloeopsis sp. ULAP01 TaxID=3056483 RepID=UPI0025AA99CB|nr:hypothetical protein [Chlorogloeopsis sp. ULAP01]MDM9381153.1 hypothetical protein [Chlorogloeopsis sp. ULAP01]